MFFVLGVVGLQEVTHAAAMSAESWADWTKRRIGFDQKKPENSEFDLQLKSLTEDKKDYGWSKKVELMRQNEPALMEIVNNENYFSSALINEYADVQAPRNKMLGLVHGAPGSAKKSIQRVISGLRGGQSFRHGYGVTLYFNFKELVWYTLLTAQKDLVKKLVPRFIFPVDIGEYPALTDYISEAAKLRFFERQSDAPNLKKIQNWSEISDYFKQLLKKVEEENDPQRYSKEVRALVESGLPAAQIKKIYQAKSVDALREMKEEAEARGVTVDVIQSELKAWFKQNKERLIKCGIIKEYASTNMREAWAIYKRERAEEQQRRAEEQREQRRRELQIELQGKP
jgi:hypothetical protein